MEANVSFHHKSFTQINIHSKQQQVEMPLINVFFFCWSQSLMHLSYALYCIKPSLYLTTPYTVRHRCYRKGMMCSCGSPNEAVVIWTRQVFCYQLLPYVQQEVIAEDKEANDHS